MSRQVYILVQEDEELYIKELLQRRFHFSSRLIRKLKVEGGVFVNDQPVRLRQKGRAGDVLQVRFPKEVSYFEPENIPLDVVYEDDDLLVVNKQPGLVVHPTKNYQTGTLANALAFFMQQSGKSFKIRFVNRLDRDTSGLILIAKNAHCQKHISDQMDRKQVRKCYRAIVHGGPDREEGIIDLPIHKDPDHVARRKVMDQGYPSVTRYRVLERFDSGTEQGRSSGYTLLELTLETGRTHQIRVHLSHRGWPVVGDELYGSLYGYTLENELMKRQALHAYELELTQPSIGERIRVKAELPEDMTQCLREIRSIDS
ncbi:MAG: RluA family pseudouridine synthase [Anaerovoracaceae bacterium]